LPVVERRNEQKAHDHEANPVRVTLVSCGFSEAQIGSPLADAHGDINAAAEMPMGGTANWRAVVARLSRNSKFGHGPRRQIGPREC